MYLIVTADTQPGRDRILLSPVAPVFTDEVLAQAAKVEVLGSCIDDPGPDFCEYRVFDVAANEIGRLRANGF